MDYSNFNMMIDKRFMSHSYFYKKVIMNWLCYSEKEFENILIYSSNMELTKGFLIKVSSEFEDYLEDCIMITQKEHYGILEIKIKAYFNNKERDFEITIKPINRLKLDQMRGLRLSGVILDVGSKNCIENYLDNELITNELLPCLLIPTDLDIGLTLYY